MSSPPEPASQAQGEHEVEPNPTVYINNIEETVKIPELEETLRGLFSEYGTILDIVAKKSLRRKGQAFVVFDNTDSAQKAIDDLDGFDLAGKAIHCTFAKTRSDATVKRTATAEELEEHIRTRKADKERKQELQKQQEASKKRKAADAPSSGKSKVARLGANDGTPTESLIVQNIPEGYDDGAMIAIFGRLPEFKEFHSVPGRKGLGFAHYNTVDAAIQARSKLAGLELGGNKLEIKFQNK